MMFGALWALSPWLHNRLDVWQAGRRHSDGLLDAFLGESRRLFASHYFVKADAYFHSGYYPTVFDHPEGGGEIHIAEAASGAEAEGEKEEEHSFEGAPKDWLERFGRNFRPNRHHHLDDAEESNASSTGQSVAAREGASGNPSGKESPKDQGLVREILPWLRLSASLDPQRIQTYVVGAFYLQSMGRADQAEEFLREGLRENPQSYELLLELGKLAAERRKDYVHARNFLEAGLRFWKTDESSKKPEDQNQLAHASLLGQLVKAEEALGNNVEALSYLQELLLISPNKDSLNRWSEELRKKIESANRSSSPVETH